jgi:hypothetical protein
VIPSRYRFTIGWGQSVIPDESSSTIDGAFKQAAALYKSTGGIVFVVDTGSPKTCVRGFVDANGWRWLSPCRRCKGTGVHKGAGCTICDGRGVVAAEAVYG